MKKYLIKFGVITNNKFIEIPQIEIKSKLIVNFKRDVDIREAREILLINSKILEVSSLIGLWIYTSFGEEWRERNLISSEFIIDFKLSEIESY